MIKLRNIAYAMLILFAVVFILIIGKSLLIPFVLAWILWFVVRQMRKKIDCFSIMRRYVPLWIKNVVSLLFLLFAVNFIVQIVISNISTLLYSYSEYKNNVQMLIQKIELSFEIQVFSNLSMAFADFDFSEVFVKILNISTDLFSSTFMILLYALFIFLEEASMKLKLHKLFPNLESYAKMQTVIRNIEESVATYLGLKTLMSLITGVLSFIVLRIVGIDSPLFWAFLIFILNYIPTIGSLVATLFPAIFCFLQFGDFSHGFIVLGFVGLIQIVVGNIIEPRMMGNAMNVSPLATIISLSFWGAIWGITGMIVSVPIMVVIVIVFSQFEYTKPIAILLSGNGKV